MKDKYYTPEISEFHVGFEYEYRNLHDKHWQKEVFNRGIGFAPNPTVEDCRVKYLDREDIESFGFKQDHNHNDVRFGYNDGSARIEHTPHQNRIQIYQWGREEDTVSGITIKNKSELKKLLKQLDIHDNN